MSRTLPPTLSYYPCVCRFTRNKPNFPWIFLKAERGNNNGIFMANGANPCSVAFSREAGTPPAVFRISPTLEELLPFVLRLVQTHKTKSKGTDYTSAVGRLIKTRVSVHAS